MPDFYVHWGYLGLFAILVLGGMGLPVPEDVPLLAAGALIHHGDLNGPVAAMVALFGVVLADSVVFTVGRWAGHFTAKRPRWLPLSESHLHRVQSLLTRYGVWMIVVARFVPGTRLGTYWCAGAMGMEYRNFLMGDGLAALVSVPVWLFVGYLGASHLDQILRGLGRVEHFITTALIFIVVTFVVIAWWRGVCKSDLK
jgi:membrane protein DedA with SNARE-associated domain